MKFQPLEDRVLIEEVKESEEKTAGGLYVPATAKKDTKIGVVYSSGPGRYAPETGDFIPCMLSKGDKVLFGAQQGMPISADGKDLILLREGDVLILISKNNQIE